MQRASHQLELVPPLDGSELAPSLPPAGRRRGGVRGRRRCRHAAVRRRGLGLALLGTARGARPRGRGTRPRRRAGAARGVLRLALLRVTVGSGADRHAPLGPRETAVRRPRPARRPRREHGRSRSCSARTTAPRGRRSSRATSRPARRPDYLTSTTRSCGCRRPRTPPPRGRRHGPTCGIGGPPPAAAGAHRRERRRHGDDDHRGVHSRGEPVGRVPDAGRRRRLPLSG